MTFGLITLTDGLVPAKSSAGLESQALLHCSTGEVGRKAGRVWYTGSLFEVVAVFPTGGVAKSCLHPGTK